MAYLYALLADEGLCDEEKPRVFRRHRDAFTALCEQQFVEKFRLCKDAVREVCDAVATDLGKPQHWRSTTFPVDQRVLIALRFYATGAFLGEIAEEEEFLTTKRPVSEAIHAVSVAIIRNLAPRYLKFPASPEEKLKIKEEFHQIAGMPGCLGAIDGTAIAIVAPSTMDARFVDRNYYCRKGYHAINVLGVSDARCRILYLNACYPGSCSDSSIWSMCDLRREAPCMFADSEWLVGDLGYPLEPWLMTPVRNPATPQEEAYNETHFKTRAHIKQCFSILKRRFRCLHDNMTLRFSPDRASNIITACAILHNICLRYNMPDPWYEEVGDEDCVVGDEGSDEGDEDSDEEDEDDFEEQEESVISRGLDTRNQILSQYFS